LYFRGERKESHFARLLEEKSKKGGVELFSCLRRGDHIPSLGGGKVEERFGLEKKGEEKRSNFRYVARKKGENIGEEREISTSARRRSRSIKLDPDD